MGGTIINMKKPMKTVRELIQHMKNKGIGFKRNEKKRSQKGVTRD